MSELAKKALVQWGEKYLTEQGIEFDEVQSVEERTFSDGYCETCYNEWVDIAIIYTEPGSPLIQVQQTYHSFQNILEEILQEEV